VRALVVGAGRMGRFHSKALTDLGYDVTTVDPDPAAGADQVRVTRRDYDAVCIATPIAHLAETADEWVGFEGRLLIEKPMASDTREARALADAMRGQRVAVGYVERFNPAVRSLRERVTGQVVGARFTRWNDRPTTDVRLDLVSHDIDLARHLRWDHAASFDTRSGCGIRRRTITVLTADGGRAHADLLAHATSPLHAQWHAFLLGRPGVATPEDAVQTLVALSQHGMSKAA
jgi:predicted dehydrogenase